MVHPLDRRSVDRPDMDVIGLLGDPRTRVLDVVGDRFPVEGDPTAPRLTFRTPETRDMDGYDLGLYLGRDGEGREIVAVLHPSDTGAPPAGRAGLREIGPWLPPAELDMAMTAQGMANWHRTHGFCPRCGSRTEAGNAGWVRRCVEEGRELYPRSDPAVIMAVVDGSDRLLLSRGTPWPEGRRSVQAGFVEPGESLEAAVAREVLEETGVSVTDVRYLGSQPWPFPASLMTGFLARATSTRLTLDPAEIAEAEWWSRQDLASAVAERRITLPGRLSIARRLIETWYGEPLVVPVIDEPGGDAWMRPQQ